ncbi:MAG TPA: TIGR01777 family oxidoreductase, partial [Holophagaceae bacterium]|nr:TIGR01777 family oxidoreductase [Holophagaceae bacterium]
MSGSVLKRVVVAGGTGLIGRHLVAALLEQGVQVTVLGRNTERIDLPGVDARDYEALPEILEDADAVFNLAGANIAGKRWTRAYKRELVESRTGITRRLVEAIERCSARPLVLVNASAIGYYGPRGGEPIDEHGAPGRSFLAELCAAWEREADHAKEHGVQVVKLRTGIVLAREGGALPKIALPMKLFQGCKLGHGQQGFSWIHIDDLVAMYIEAAANPAWEGAINATAPRPLTNQTFTRALARQLHRPVLPVPAFLTRLGAKVIAGEMACELLEGAFIYPRQAEKLGFRFRFERIEDA